jgi:hypothetical protein
MCTKAIRLLEGSRFDEQMAGLRALSYLAENSKQDVSAPPNPIDLRTLQRNLGKL